MRPQDKSFACEQLIRCFLATATRPEFSLKLFCDDLQTNPDKLWQFCQDAFGHPPSDILDWARATAFLDMIETEPILKMRAVGKRLGFMSTSSFNQFAHRAFGTTPQAAKRDIQTAKEKMRVRYKAIQECYEQMIQSSPRKPKPEQTNSTKRVLTKRNTETETSWKKEKKKVR